jgi:DNA-binding HxlR family transcriptional regulator
MNSEREMTDAGVSLSQEIGLREHDKEVLAFLSQNPSSMMGFQGLKRRLGIHSEQLSRALRRLSADGFVEQTELGYRVTQKGLTILDSEVMTEDHAGITILQTYMPGNMDAREAVAVLKGSWIGPLRWQGLTESPDGLRLSWITEDGKAQLDATIRGGQLAISAVTTFHERVDEAVRLGHLLFNHISRAASGEEFRSVSA